MTTRKRTPPQPDPTEVWLTPEQLAERIQRPVRTIRNWREAKVQRGPVGTKLGGRIRYRLSDVQAWESAGSPLNSQARDK